jgi:hypothetical protein
MQKTWLSASFCFVFETDEAKGLKAVGESFSAFSASLGHAFEAPGFPGEKTHKEVGFTELPGPQDNGIGSKNRHVTFRRYSRDGKAQQAGRFTRFAPLEYWNDGMTE